MTAAYARGACPGLSAPMVTGDGLLVRLMAAGPIPLDAFIGLCQAADAHGNGTMEISARGSVQVRGLTELSAPLFAGAVAALDIDISEGVPVLADPLPDDPAALIDSNSIAAALHRAIAERMLPLAPKVSVVVDGGGRIDLDAVPADIRLRATATSEGSRFHVALAGDASTATAVGVITSEEAVDTVLALLSAIAAKGMEARAGDLLRAHGAAQSRSPSVPVTPQLRAEPIGLHRLKDGACALGLGLAFGHVHAEALAQLVQFAHRSGARWVRPAPDRALLLGPLTQANAMAATRGAEKLGFIVDAADPRRRIAACPGAPACAHGLIAARELAAEIARHVPLPGDGIAIHVSGCAKGCAHPKPAPLTIVGTEQGCGIVRHGSAQGTPSAYARPADLVAELDRITGRKREAAHA